MRLGILASHPIQYHAPWFRALAAVTDLEVFFAHKPDAAQQGEGFGKAFTWDVDLLDGYTHKFLENVSRHPSPSHFFGCDTPEIGQIIGKSESRKQKAEVRPPTSGLRSPISSLPSPDRRRFSAFIVCGWHLKSYWQAVRACRRAGVPVLIRGDSQLLTPRSALKRMIKEMVYPRILRQFDGFLAVGQRNREYLRHYGVPEERMFAAPHFVESQRSEVGSRRSEGRGQRAEGRDQKSEGGGQKSEIRKRWGIPEDAFCVVFCGKFIPKKRPMDLVNAARVLATHDSFKSKLHLLFIGSGELGPQLRANCNILFDAESPLDAPRSTLHAPRSTLHSPAPPATFTGFLNQTELPAAYAAADVLVLPSEGGETWGLVVNEAMACGLPAIVSDAVGCAPDLIEEGLTGFTYPVGDVKSLTERLSQIARLYQKGWDFGPHLRKKLEGYTVQAAVEGTIRACEAVTAQLRNR